MKNLLFILFSAFAFSCTAQTVTNRVYVDSPAYVVTDIGTHILGTQVRGIGIAYRIPGSNWLTALLIGNYTNDYGTNGKPFHTQLGVFNEVTHTTANTCWRVDTITGEYWTKTLNYDGTNLSSYEMKGGTGLLINVNGCKYETPVTCNEGLLYHTDNNEPMIFRPTVLDSIDAYHVVTPAAGQTVWCTDCTNGTPQPGAYLVHNGTAWIRLKIE
jgi:hypothetical protein